MRLAMASDFDDTIYFGGWRQDRPQPHWLDADVEAIRRFQTEGGLFGVCTGRSLRGVTDVPDLPIDFDFYVTCSGAFVADREGRTIFSRAIPRDLLLTLHDEFLEAGRRPPVMASSSYFGLGEPAWSVERQIASIDDLPNEDFYVFSINFNLVEEAAAVAKLIGEKYGDVVECFHNQRSVDVAAKGCSKGSGLLIAKEALGVDLMAGAGDSYNDLPTLRSADVSYTFNRVPKEVQAEATVVVDTMSEALADLMSRA